MFRARDIIGRQLHHMTRLVDELLDVSRFNQGKITLRRDLVELRSALNTAVKTVRPLLEERQHSLRLSLPEQPLPIRGDTVRLTQIFANLLHNAAQYTPEGGTLAVEAAAADGRVIVRVSDNGTGLSPALQRQLFDPLAPEVPAIRWKTCAAPDGTSIAAANVAASRALEPDGAACRARRPGRRCGPASRAAPRERNLRRARRRRHRPDAGAEAGHCCTAAGVSAESPGRNLGSTFVVELPVEPWQQLASADREIAPAAGHRAHHHAGR